MKTVVRIIVLLEVLVFLPLLPSVAIGLLGVFASVVFGWFGMVWFLTGFFIVGCTVAVCSLTYYAASNGKRILKPGVALFFSVCGLILLAVFSWTSEASWQYLIQLLALAHMIYLCRSCFVAEPTLESKSYDHG